MADEQTDISIDFEKIKKFAKKTAQLLSSKQTEQGQIGQEADYTDVKKIKEFIVKYKTPILLFILLFLQFVPNQGYLPWGGIDMRLEFENVPISQKSAIDTTYQQLLQKTYLSIDQQQPNLPQEEKLATAKQQIDFAFKNDPKIKQEIQKVEKFIRSEYSYTENQRQYTLLPDIDPYYYLRLANNLVKKGTLGDTTIDGVPWDTHTVAPLGSNISITMHPYTLAYLYKGTKIFNAKTTLMQAAAYFPIIMTILAIIAVFFVSKRLFGLTGGMLAGTLFSLNYIAFSKTMWGMTDTDAYNLLVPIIFAALFCETLISTQRKKTVLLIFASSATIAAYSLIWSGWAYMLNLAILTSIIYFAYLIKNRKENPQVLKDAKSIVYKLIGFAILSTMLLSMTLTYHQFAQIRPLEGLNSVWSQLLGPIKFTQIKTATKIDLWPNVYTTVAELAPASLDFIVRASGGIIFFITSILGLILLLKNKTKQKIVYGIFLTTWILAGIYASTKGQRFILILVVPLIISASNCIIATYNKIKQLNKNKILRLILTLLLFGAVALFISANITGINAYLKNSTQIINNAMWQSLNVIKENSSPDAIITSWWDFGHAFAYLSDRKVTFDGASQNTPMAHWVGKILSTNNETEAIGILQMLNCGSNNAYHETYEQVKDPFKTIKIINKIITSKKEDAKKYLEEQKIQDTQKILQYTHCDAPEAFFITSEDMRRKAAVWSKLGNWDFKKAYIWQELKNKQQDEAVNYMISNFNYTTKQATQEYNYAQTLTTPDEITNWISPPSRYSDIISCSTKNNEINCKNMILANLQTPDVKVKYGEEYITPKNAVYIDPSTGKFTNKKLPQGENSTISAIIIPDVLGSYYAAFTTANIGDSIFTRLMYFDAHDLTKFKQLTKRKLIEGGFISVWKIDWNSTTQNVMPAMQTKDITTNTSIVTFNLLNWIEDGQVLDSTIKDWKTLNITSDSDFDKNPTKPTTRKLGTKQMLPKLEEALIGMKQHQTKTIKITPQELTTETELLKKLGNKTINFKIRIERIT